MPPQVPIGPSAAQPFLVLRTKLLVPRPAPASLPRPRLLDRLIANLGHPVTLVTANAGSGKTTLVADFVRLQARQVVWFQLDRADADPSVFLAYITLGIRQLIPDFGQATLSYLQQSASEVSQHPEHAVDVLLNEVLDRVEQQLILVLDDYHHLGTETVVHAMVDRLLAYLPDVLHTIIISRDLPPLQLARLRSQDRLAIIDRSDLLFTNEETQAFFRQAVGLELTPHQLAEYRVRTQGWVTALQLLRQVVQRKLLAGQSGVGEEAVAVPEPAEVFRSSEREIFDYFAEEVFTDEPERIRRLLLRISLLERIDLDTCARLYPDAGCSTILPALVRRHVFVTIASDGRGEEYRLHPLFQSFLRRRMILESGRAAVTAEQARIADYFLERGNWDQAMHHLLAAGEFERAAAVIAERGLASSASGSLASFVSYADAIPVEVLERYPRALASRAEVARLRGEYDSAQAWFRRAAALLHDQGDREGEAEALHSLATIARRRSDFTEAFDYLDRATELTDEGSVVRIKCGNTRGLCLVSLGHWTEAEGSFRAALQSAEEHRDEHYARLIVHNLGLPAMIRGDFGEALRWLRRLLRDDEQTATPMPQEATAHLNMARCYLYRGDLTACEEHLERALERCQLFNLTGTRAETFEAYGNLYRERRDTARAAEFYGRAGRAYEEAGIDVVGCELLEEQAVLRLQTGDVAAARGLLDQLISARRAMKNELGIQTATLARSRVLLALDDNELARVELEPALSYFHKHGLYFYEAQASMTLTLCDLAAGQDVHILKPLRRALDLAARYDYEYWLKREVLEHAGLFASTEAADLLPPELREELVACSTRAEPTVSRAVHVVTPKPLANLTINMLGPVEIFRDPLWPFAADAWTTRRARDILCYIASRRHRRASKDMVIEIFWEDADLDVVSKNFHPTISHIRKGLNSNQPLKQNFLLYRDGDYMLNSEFSYAIDTEEFDRLVAESDAARRAGQHDQCISLYEAAVNLYRGEYMQGCYDEWVEEQRSYYHEQYLLRLEALAMAAQKAKDWARSLQLAQQILCDDPFREDIHNLVMYAHAAHGNRVAVKEQFEILRNLLRKELGVEPAAETQKIYRELLG